MRKCRCGAALSDNAKFCSSCGAPAQPLARPFPYKDLKWIPIVILPLIAVTMCIKVADDGMYSEPKEQLTPEQKAAAAAAELRTNAVYSCREFVRRSLKDPDSGKFELPEESYAKEESPGVWHVQIDGKARNSFNAVLRGSWDCRMQRSGTNWTLLGIKELS